MICYRKGKYFLRRLEEKAPTRMSGGDCRNLIKIKTRRFETRTETLLIGLVNSLITNTANSTNRNYNGCDAAIFNIPQK